MADRALIQSIVFTQEGGVDITYAESRDVTPAGNLLHLAQVNPGVVDLDELITVAREVLDAFLAAQHPAPERIVRVQK